MAACPRMSVSAAMLGLAPLLLSPLSGLSTWQASSPLGAYLASRVVGFALAGLALIWVCALQPVRRGRSRVPGLLLAAALCPLPEEQLWGGLSHVGAALVCSALVLCPRQGEVAQPHLWGLGLLLLLGLAWNQTQSSFLSGWAWDWIELTPVLGLAAWAVYTHRWGLKPWAGLVVLWAYLVVHRAGLLASAHHLTPARGEGWILGLVGFGPRLSMATPCLWVFFSLGGIADRPGLAHSGLGGLGQAPSSRPSLNWEGVVPTHGWAVGALLTGGLGAWALPQGVEGLPWLGLAAGGLSRARSRLEPTCFLMSHTLRYFEYSKRWMRGQAQIGTAPFKVDLLWGAGRFNRHLVNHFLRYASVVTVPYFRPSSVFGFALLVAIYAQMYSGFLLALFYLPDPSFVIPTREDLCLEVWWFGYIYKAHVLGVDILFVLSYLHILKKIYLKNFAEGDLDGWFTGAYAFLVYHVVVFLGITLSTNHLGDVTIMIAANIFWSLFCRWHKVYAPFFSNKHLSTEQLTRFMVAHYISAWYYVYLVQTHVLFIHEMWDADANRSTQQTALTPKGSWGWDALKKEVMSMFTLYKFIAVLFFLMAHPDARVVNYSFFEQWSETEMEEVNFFIVAPHWYFRAHMGLLTVCAHHYEGLAWLVGFYVALCYTPHLYRFWNGAALAQGQRAESVPTRQSLLQEVAYVCFFASILYVGGSLPCGRFYYENVEGFFGNSFLRLSYEYIYLYLGMLAHLVESVERWYLALPLRKAQLSQVRPALDLDGEGAEGAQKGLLSRILPLWVVAKLSKLPYSETWMPWLGI